MRPYLLLTSVLTTAALVGLTGCGGDDTAGGEAKNDPTPTSEPEAQDVPDEAPRDDLKITACADDAGLTATLEVTNSFDSPMEYHGTILFKDASGATVTEGLFNTGTLEAGATGTEEVPGPNIYEPVPGVTCELGEAELDEPE